MPGSESFLNAILADPGRDESRLVFADWLDDHEQHDRAELIRIQIEAESLGKDERRHKELSWRAVSLIAKHGERWRSELPVLPGVTWRDFERGFVSTVRVDHPETLLTYSEAIARAAPVYRVELLGTDHLDAHKPKGALPWLRALRVVTRHGWSRFYKPKTQPDDESLLGTVESLEIADTHEAVNFNWLLAAEPKRRLTALSFSGSHVAGLPFARWVVEVSEAPLEELRIGTRFIDHNSGYYQDPTLGLPGAQMIASSPHLAGLSRLSLDRQRIGNDGLSTILGALTRLEDLSLRAIEITTLAPFAQTRHPLRRLDLSENAVGDSGVAVLAASPSLAQLTLLALDTCEIGPNGLRALVSAPIWQSLRVLDLRRNPLGREGVEVLAAAAHPENLHTLLLADCDLGADAALGAVPWLRDLLELDLSKNMLSPHALDGLAGGAIRALSIAETAVRPLPLLGSLPQIVRFDASGCDLSGEGALLAGLSARTPHLQSLRLARTGLPLAAVARESWPLLSQLSFSGNPIDLRDLQSLIEGPLAGTLSELALRGCGVGPSAVMLLAGADTLTALRCLDLRGEEMSREALLVLARSEALRRVVSIRSDFDLQSIDNGERQLLFARFGTAWWYTRDEEAEQDDLLLHEYAPYVNDDTSDDDDLPF